jgi:hypothetical protein
MKASSLDPLGRHRYVPCEVVKHRTDRAAERNPETVPVGEDPFFLLRSPETDPKHVRRDPIHKISHFLIFHARKLGLKRRRVRACDRQSRENGSVTTPYEF